MVSDLYYYYLRDDEKKLFGFNSNNDMTKHKWWLVMVHDG